MSGGGKSVATGSEARSKKSVVEEKGKRVALRTREARDFDPKPCVLCGQKEVDEYLVLYDISLPSKIEVEWCLSETDVTVSPFAGSVYFHPQILALEGKLPMIPFVRDVLAHFKVSPSQLTPGAWRTVLGFETLGAPYAPISYEVEEFCTIYTVSYTHLTLPTKRIV